MAGGIFTFMAAERIQESGDNYKAENRGSGASGAYQFLMGTWQQALRMAGLGNTQWYITPAADAPPSVQDAAAQALMAFYYASFGRNWYNVAEAWYGGPGAVGHPNWGGGPGFPNVGQYAADVMAIYNRLAGQGGGAPQPPPPVPSPIWTQLQDGFTTFYAENVLGADVLFRANANYLMTQIVPYPG